MIGGWDEGTLARFIEDRVEPLLQRFGGAGRWEVGDLKIAAYSTPDAGWLLCDGTAVSRTTYDQLFRRISTTYGAGDGSTTFNLPDFRGRAPAGVGDGDASGHTNLALGSKVGKETHALSVAELASHSHTHTVSTAGGATTDGGAIPPHNSVSSGVQTVTDATGSGTAHENRGPRLGVNFFIRT